jgi:hypothetical protein
MDANSGQQSRRSSKGRRNRWLSLYRWEELYNILHLCRNTGVSGRYGHAWSIEWLSFKKTCSKINQKKNAMRSIMRYALCFALLRPTICIFMNICEQTEYLLSKVTPCTCYYRVMHCCPLAGWRFD